MITRRLRREGPFFRWGGRVLGVLCFWWLAASVAAAVVPLDDKERAWLVKHPVITVHNEMNWPPFNFNQNGQPTGFSVDYMNLLAVKMGLNIRYISGPEWDEFMAMIRDGRLDVMLNIVNTPGRREFMSFTNPYLSSPSGIFVTRDNDSIHSLEDLNGKTVAIPRGFFFQEVLETSYPKIKLLLEDDTLDNLESVAFGRADATVGEPGVVQYLIDTHFLTNIKLAGQATDRRFTSVMSIGVNKDQAILRDILQKGVESITQQEMQHLFARWNLAAADQADATTLNDEDQRYLVGLNDVQVCVQSDHMPYEGQANGQLSGISADLLRQLSQRLKLSFHPRFYSTSAELLEAAGRGDCDLVPLISMAAGQSGLRYTKPFLDIPIVLATGSDEIFVGDVQLLKDRKLGYVPGLFSFDALKKRYPQLQLVAVSSMADAVRRIRDGELYGYVDSVAAIAYGMQQHGWYDIKIAGRFDEQLHIAMGVHSSTPHLLGVVQKTLNAMGTEVPKRIYNQWVSVRYVQSVDYTWIWRGGLALAVLMAFLWYRNYQLKKFNRKLERITITDPLTGVSNRKLLDEVLAREVDLCAAGQYSVGLILLDLDHFKLVNDRYGHQEGDAVLNMVCRSVEQVINHKHVFGRWGGEEFMVICPGLNLAATGHLAEILRREISQAVQGPAGNQTASLGVTAYQRGDSCNDLIRRADAALYQAKEAGRNRVQLHPPAKQTSRVTSSFKV
ncbi:diguanylate cyclase [Pokkaliibacter plantistimulans]|uniref:transporter substrate-binding domain-containing diguanylate cyclase n=1 Tax=Pokkaliibacter plantistimulans TaxID=1635171 RepID=UPI00105780A0|nr:transporter substrate-binding domain-containing protein [Pokkaliibacter plantistimulans]